MTDNAFPRLFTLREVAERTGFAFRTLQRDCRAGRVTHVHRGRDRLMTEQQIQDLIDKHTTKPKPAIPDHVKIAAQKQLDRMLARKNKR